MRWLGIVCLSLLAVAFAAFLFGYASNIAETGTGWYWADLFATLRVADLIFFPVCLSVGLFCLLWSPTRRAGRATGQGPT